MWGSAWNPLLSPKARKPGEAGAKTSSTGFLGDVPPPLYPFPVFTGTVGSRRTGGAGPLILRVRGPGPLVTQESL